VFHCEKREQKIRRRKNKMNPTWITKLNEVRRTLFEPREIKETCKQSTEMDIKASTQQLYAKEINIG